MALWLPMEPVGVFRGVRFCCFLFITHRYGTEATEYDENEESEVLGWNLHWPCLVHAGVFHGAHSHYFIYCSYDYVLYFNTKSRML